jgi:hypothetical protein
MRHLRLFVGVIAGYGTMVVLITLVQETWFGGVGWNVSPPGVLAVAGTLTFLSAVVGAAVGTWIGGRRTRVVGQVMSLLVVTETTLLTYRGRLDGPLWFDLAAAGSLIAGILIGAAVARRWAGRARATA